MEFRILGPVAAVADDRELPLGGPKQRAFLATLLLRAGQVVSRDRLIDALWGDDPPTSAVRSLQVYAHGLRRALGADRIETHGQGYLLRASPADVDLGRFEELVERGRRALSSHEPALAAEL
ncbi:MAG: AfsR family transcriptional regulator, partial [Actinobacteria bacterium]